MKTSKLRKGVHLQEPKAELWRQALYPNRLFGKHPHTPHDLRQIDDMQKHRVLPTQAISRTANETSKIGAKPSRTQVHAQGYTALW